MAELTLQHALEREHREIDGGIETYTAQLDRGASDPLPLIRAMHGLRRHIYLEETFLFPPLKESGLTMPIFVMEREHGALWDRMESIGQSLAGTDDAESMAQACRELLSLLDAHNSKEEPIIYTQADSTLSAEASDELRNFLEHGDMPEGWTCVRATATEG
ncbi:hemerythrin domain-containing protein [Paramicrobacterium fandaimingii]|uniref:hemerythrin domain-containing protein n=1 Tax=Paramicrobacterium fandaimingii TaxID=2708079 RepID=UPI001423EA5D|nr:hemerythrin domain-containing protein [Microbacterium fandaimingii]